jgi:predicted nucleic acid-binding protein
VTDQPLYKKPYLDSCVFIAWIMGERPPIKRRGKIVKSEDGTELCEERALICENLLKLARQGVFSIVTSAITLAEVHKKKSEPRLTDEKTQDFLNFCKNDFINIVVVDRKIGEEANALCQKYRLYPNDAIHLACAKKANCDVLLSWDGPLNKITDAGIRIENPVMWTPPEKPKLPVQLSLLGKGA